jgi:hypothetical protein
MQRKGSNRGRELFIIKNVSVLSSLNQFTVYLQISVVVYIEIARQ